MPRKWGSWAMGQDIRIVMPPPVSQIIGRLESEGCEAYAVGGCVRDTCLGRTPSDWDITTSASPPQIKSLFPRTVDTGIEHGTVTVLIGKTGYEVTTFRIDGPYEDARHPREVIFTPELKEDLRRRDFTINAMAYNDRTGLVDLFGGLADLEQGIVRCVGEAKERFAEDALRILRAVRFCAQLGFSIETETARAARLLSPNLRRISAERIYAELGRLLASDHPDWLRLAWELGITREVLPEFDAVMAQEQTGPHHSLNVGEHTLLAMRQVRPDLVLRLTMLLHDTGKALCGRRDEQGVWHFPGHAQKSAQIAESVLRRLKSDRNTQRKVCALISAHSQQIPEGEVQIRRMASRMGAELFSLYLEVKRADILAQRKDTQAPRLKKIRMAALLWEKIRRRGDALTVGELALSGRDLISLGMKPGKAVGEVLESLLDMVLENPENNDRPLLLNAAAEFAGHRLEGPFAPNSCDGRK